MTTGARNAKLEGNWEQLRGRVRQAWGDLTDDDVQQGRGNWEELVGVVRERTGESIEKIEAKLSELLDKAEQAGSDSDR